MTRACEQCGNDGSEYDEEVEIIPVIHACAVTMNLCRRCISKNADDDCAHCQSEMFTWTREDHLHA